MRKKNKELQIDSFSCNYNKTCSICIAPFARGYTAPVPIITVSGKSTVISIHIRAQLASAHLISTQTVIFPMNDTSLMRSGKRSNKD